jgi:hypothetical protein
MGPKVESALEFLDEGGSAAIITVAPKLAAALADRAGTRITRDPAAAGVRRQLPLFEGSDEPLDGGAEAPREGVRVA